MTINTQRAGCICNPVKPRTRPYTAPTNPFSPVCGPSDHAETAFCEPTPSENLTYPPIGDLKWPNVPPAPPTDPPQNLTAARPWLATVARLIDSSVPETPGLNSPNGSNAPPQLPTVLLAEAADRRF